LERGLAGGGGIKRFGRITPVMFWAERNKVKGAQRTAEDRLC